MPKHDSVDKIVTSYFAAVNAVPFTYKGKQHPVKTLIVSPLLLRGFTCPAQCGGCCHSVFTLDYLPRERQPYPLELRTVTFDDRPVLILTDHQHGREANDCKNLRHDDGRCDIHGAHPFSCDFELVRLLHTTDDLNARMLTRLYGRGHAMMRVDGERGAMCTITPADEASIADTLRKLRRLAQWCEHFGLEHRVHHIIKWAEARPQQPLVLSPPSTKPNLFTS